MDSLEYLQGKWRSWYKSSDVKHDGIITWEDVEECRNSFTDLNHFLGDRADKIKETMGHWWTTYILRNGPSKPITEQEFVDHLTASWKKDKNAFKKEMQNCFAEMVNAVDANQDRCIDLKEYINVFKAYGHDNEALITKAFELFNAPDGKIPVEDVVNKWVIFTTSEDPNERDVVNEAWAFGL